MKLFLLFVIAWLIAGIVAVILVGRNEGKITLYDAFMGSMLGFAGLLLFISAHCHEVVIWKAKK